MKTVTVILIVMLAALATSCIPSLFPLYNEEDLVTDDRIVGTWDAGENDTWVIERLDYTPSNVFFGSEWSEPEEKKSYKLEVIEVS
ncbi:MAG: hypothetical protein KAT31_17020, partial [Bacteroidales bacterium]|nr:hypothetical protein [Bacteroidales bacterium]